MGAKAMNLKAEININRVEESKEEQWFLQVPKLSIKKVVTKKDTYDL